MSRFMHTFSTFIVALSMVTLPLTVSADRPGGAQHQAGQSHRSGGGNSHSGGGATMSRPSSVGRSGNATVSRPATNTVSRNNNMATRGGAQATRSNSNNNHRSGGNNLGTTNSNNRPGNQGNVGTQGNRHGNQGNTGRPGNVGNQGRPGGMGNQGRPGGYSRPPYHRPYSYQHHVPFFGHFTRPVPPPSWRAPLHGGPLFGTILGIALGTTIDLTLDALLNQGYTISSYGDDVVYLSNVRQMNYLWPDAAMYYNNGQLYGSSFTYATSFNDMSRYNALYNTFCRQYGNPASYSNSAGVISASWFGTGNRYVTLEYNANYNGYYTTLNFGM